jgi:hypothetical protein
MFNVKGEISILMQYIISPVRTLIQGLIPVRKLLLYVKDFIHTCDLTFNFGLRRGVIPLEKYDVSVYHFDPILRFDSCFHQA